METKITVYEEKHEMKNQLDIQDIIENYKSSIDVQDITKGSYLSGIKKFINWINLNEVETVNRQVLLKYKKYLKATYSSAGTVNQYLTSVRSLFNYLETLGVPNLMTTIKGLKQGNNHKRLPLTKEQALNIQDNIKRETLQEKRDYAIYQLCLRNGLRQIELNRSNISDISVIDNENILYLHGKYQDDKDTFVVLCATVMNAINDYLHLRNIYKEDDPLFISLATNTIGNRLTTRNIRRIITKMLVDNGVKNKRVTPHSLRHTAITNLTKASNNDLLQAKTFARHEDINTTAIYIHEENRIKNAPEKILEKYFNEKELETSIITTA